MVSLFTNVLVFLMSITEDWVSFGIWTICWTKLKTDAPESFGGLQNFTRLSISMNVRRSWLKFHFSGELLSTLEEFGALKSDGLLSLYNYILTLAEGLRRENISGAHIKMTNYCWRSLKCVPPSLLSVHHPPIQVPSWTRHHYHPPPPPPSTPTCHPPSYPRCSSRLSHLSLWYLTHLSPLLLLPSPSFTPPFPPSSLSLSLHICPLVLSIFYLFILFMFLFFCFFASLYLSPNPSLCVPLHFLTH